MTVVSSSDDLELAQQLLRGIAWEATSGDVSTDLEQRVSMWLARPGTGTRNAGPALLALRTAVIETSGMDSTFEPVPLCGLDPSPDVAKLVVYLRSLVSRAVSAAHCEPEVIVERTLGYMRERHLSELLALSLA